MTKVFISYRRKDSDAFADAMHDEFIKRLGTLNTFLDVNGIEPGEDFATTIKQRIASSTVVIVLVGADWLNARTGSGERRIDLADDWVRLELREALSQGKRIIPVLVRQGTMPERHELPEDISGFSNIHAFKISSLLVDLPRLGGIVEGKLSVAEPMVLMAFAASQAYAERAIQQQRAKAFTGGEDKLDGAAWIAGQYYQAVGTSVYYSVILFGVLFALRVRAGWRLEEMLRITLCATIGVALASLLGSISVQVFKLPADYQLALRLSLWFTGLAAGAFIGLRLFAPIAPIPKPTAIAVCAGVAVAAFLGSMFQGYTSELLKTWIQAYYGFSRSAFWAPILIAVVSCWWIADLRRNGVKVGNILSVLLPVLAIMLIADAFSIFMSFFLHATDSAALSKAIRDMQGQDNAIFFASMAGVASWRINHLIQHSKW